MQSNVGSSGKTPLEIAPKVGLSPTDRKMTRDTNRAARVGTQRGGCQASGNGNAEPEEEPPGKRGTLASTGSTACRSDG